MNNRENLENKGNGRGGNGHGGNGTRKSSGYEDDICSCSKVRDNILSLENLPGLMLVQREDVLSLHRKHKELEDRLSQLEDMIETLDHPVGSRYRREQHSQR